LERELGAREEEILRLRLRGEQEREKAEAMLEERSGPLKAERAKERAEWITQLAEEKQKFFRLQDESSNLAAESDSRHARELCSVRGDCDRLERELDAAVMGLRGLASEKAGLETRLMEQAGVSDKAECRHQGEISLLQEHYTRVQAQQEEAQATREASSQREIDTVRGDLELSESEVSRLGTLLDKHDRILSEDSLDHETIMIETVRASGEASHALEAAKREVGFVLDAARERAAAIDRLEQEVDRERRGGAPGSGGLPYPFPPTGGHPGGGGEEALRLEYAYRDALGFLFGKVCIRGFPP